MSRNIGDIEIDIHIDDAPQAVFVFLQSERDVACNRSLYTIQQICLLKYTAVVTDFPVNDFYKLLKYSAT